MELLTQWNNFAQVHWFPRHISELDLIANRTLDAGTDLEADHPGFRDAEYRARRARLARQALEFRTSHDIPHTEYTRDEVETWGLVWDTMEDLWDKVSAMVAPGIYSRFCVLMTLCSLGISFAIHYGCSLCLKYENDSMLAKSTR